jgi:hypothetical protein
MDIEDCGFWNNIVKDNGAGLYVLSGSVTIERTSFYANTGTLFFLLCYAKFCYGYVLYYVYVVLCYIMLYCVVLCCIMLY